MRAEQAIYTSARTQKIRGYQLIGRSPGVDERQARSLIQWCPSHGGLACSQTDASTLNFHPVSDDIVALSRTVYGGPEYSARGGLQVFTRILLLRGDDLADYDYDATTLARIALSLGHLRLEPNTPEHLPTIELPSHTMLAPRQNRADSTQEIVQQITQCLSDGKSVVVVGLSNPLDALAQVFDRFPGRQRLELTFTTGLKPSLYRPFRIQFLPSVNLPLQQQLVSQGSSVLTAVPLAAAAI